MSWLHRLFSRDRLDKDLDKELQFHVESQVRDLVAAGVPIAEAKRRALASFGGIEPIREMTHDARGTRWVEDFSRDIRYAFRTMRRSPAFTIAAVLSLAVGIGANTAIFTIVNALLIRPLPVSHPEQLQFLNIAGYDQASDSRFSYPKFKDYQAQLTNASLAAMTRTVRMQVLAGNDNAELALGQLVSGEWFRVLGVPAAAGRVFSPDDNTTMDGHPVVVISHAYWLRRFGGSAAAIGSTIRVSGVPMTVIGVAAENFSGLAVGESVDFWAPAMMQSRLRYASNADIDDADSKKPWVPQDGIRWLWLVARIVPPVSTSQVQAEAQTMFHRNLEQAAATVSDKAAREYFLRGRLELAPAARGTSEMRDTFGRAVLVLMSTAALVLLIACANLANLLMARSASRGREFALRLALGAGRGRLIRQLLTEALALSLLAGAASVFLAEFGAHALLRLASDGPAPIAMDVSIDWATGAFAAGISVATGLLFGLLPALRLSRSTAHDAMKSGGRVAGTAGGSLASRALVVVQVALSLLLLIGATLFVRTLHNLLSADAGFEREHVVQARFDARTSGYTPATLPGLHHRLLDGAAALPGARSVAIAKCGPVANCHSTSDITVPGRTNGVGNDADVQEDDVSAAYFETVGMKLISGRTFGPYDTDHSPLVAVVNETMARHFFGDANPVGKHFQYDKNSVFEVVGLVRDAKVNGLREPTPRMAYYPIDQHPDEFIRNVYARVAGPVDLAREGMRPMVAAVDQNLAVREVVTLEDLAERTVARERLVSELTGAFGLLAVLVACLGLYGTVSYSVARRTNEIGIRMALGASLASVRWLVLRETMWLILAGAAVGLAVTLPLLQFINALLYGLSPRDPVTLMSAVSTLLVVGVIAAWAIPAWRASRVSPVTALRAE